MTRFALLTLFTLTALGGVPTIASACCADFDRHEPIGWSVDGALLVSAYESAECDGASTVEIHSPGDVVADARFDLYRGGRRLEGGELASMINVWELEDDVSVDDFPVPAHLERRFAYDITSLCPGDLAVVGRADPEDALGTGYWESHVLLTVSVRTDDGFVPVLEDLRVSRGLAEEAEVRVHPSPDGTDALVRITIEGPDVISDDLHWISAPAGMAASSVSCGRGELVIPARDNMRQPGLEGENWFVSDALHAQEELASARDHAEARDMARYVQMNVNRALWSDPGNDVIRAALVAALEGVGATDIATEVAVDLTDESYPSLASIAPPPASPTPTATPALPAAADLPKLPDVSPLCLDDAGCPLPAEILQGPPSKPAHAASCNVAAGASSTLAVVLPVLVFAGGLGFAARRRRRQR